LFLVVMQALSQMMTTTMDRGLLTSFSMGSRNNKALVVSHLFFADDTLIFCNANSKQILHIQCIFLCFEAVSEIVPVGEVEDVENLSSVLGCRVSSLPMKYLGLPLGASYNVTSI
jgi:hypothetical protein